MPVTRGEEIRITETEVELQQRSERLGVELPPQNRLDALPMSIAHILKYIEETDNDEALKQIARKSTKKLRDKGVIRPAKKKGKLTDRALLHLYLNFSPFVLAFAVITPLFVWVAWGLVKRLWPLTMWLSSDVALSLSQSCPPDCTWYHLGLWAVLGGVSLLASFLFSYSLRKRLLRAVNPE